MRRLLAAVVAVLAVASPAAAQDAPAAPAAVRIWNSDVLAPHQDILGHDEAAKLGPIRIVGARGGVFSGKVVVGKVGALKGVSAKASDLVHAAGRGRIPADRVRVRYALVGPWGSWHRLSKAINRFDILAETPPEEVRPVSVSRPSAREAWIPKGRAILPVWVTVAVPTDAPAGQYEGTLTVRVPGRSAAVPVPIRLQVCDWTVPSPRRWRTWTELFQSPDTLSITYRTPLWSEKHWKLIDRSMAYVAAMGTRTCYVPLICETNLGNAESMVRWVKGPDGTFRHDFTVMDQYLDVVQKHLGKPEIVTFCVWDNFLEGGQFGGDARFAHHPSRVQRMAYKGKGPEVTAVGPGGKLTKELLPQYSDPKARPLWAPLVRQLRERMKRRGLEGAMALGMVTDNAPTAAVVECWKALMGNVGWVRHAHGSRPDLHGQPYRYQLRVWGIRFANPNKTADQHGWRRPDLLGHLARDMRDNFPILSFRYVGEMNVGGTLRGFGRFGADFWPIYEGTAYGRSRRRAKPISDGRYPKSSWRNLNIYMALLSPGPDGAIGTGRYEMLREGVQECEARILIDEALLTGKIKGDLAERCRKLLNERDRAMVKGFDISNPDNYGANFVWYCSPSKATEAGILWHAKSDWPSRSAKLFTAAGEVAAAAARSE